MCYAFGMMLLFGLIVAVVCFAALGTLLAIGWYTPAIILFFLFVLSSRGSRLDVLSLLVVGVMVGIPLFAFFALGWIGAILLLVCFLWLAWRGLEEPVSDLKWEDRSWTSRR